MSEQEPPGIGANRGILVLGMHRSGTSLVTGILHLLGANLGRSLLGAAAENPTGFWEHEAVIDINDRLLALRNLSWHTPSLLPDDASLPASESSLLDEAAALIESEFGANGLWAMKDPRLCRLVPFWQTAIGAQGKSAAYLHVLRHPLEVAASLHSRNGYPRDLSLLLWLLYNLEAERATRGKVRCFQAIDALYADPWPQVRQWLRAFDLTPPATDELRARIDAFVRPGLRHHDRAKLDWESVDGRIAELARKGHECLARLARQDHEALYPELDAVFTQVSGYLEARSQGLEAHRTKSVTVLVPVYKGRAATARCIDSIRANTDAAYRLLVVDDASPEPELASDLDALTAAGQIELLRNDVNKGFVHSVNRGFAHTPENDVVILNSDTEVPPGWLSRLKDCAYSNAWIGTVTPLSNNGTLCSYPVPNVDNPLPAGMSLATLDAAARSANPGRCLDIPTAVGFCTYLRRDCLNAVGAFDEEHFGKGYGEENDFSMRAVELGWRNVVCADLFVYHQGGVSFGAQTVERGARAEAQVIALHPRYPDRVADFMLRDPLRDLRNRIDWARARCADADGIAAIIAERYREQAYWHGYWVAELKSVWADAAHLRETIAKLEDSRTRLADELQTTIAALRHAEDIVRQREETIREREAGIIARDRTIVELHEIAALLRGEVAERNDRVRQLGERLAIIENSRGWRALQWMRRLARRASV